MSGGAIDGESLGIVAIPRDPTPYQELLYGPLRRRGARVRYGGLLTPSQTLNVLLLPLELAWLRIRNYRVLHLHWVFGFRLSAIGGSRLAARVSRLWFDAVLRMAGRLGFRIVWTAHNVLPHAQVFDDDAAARRTVVKACSLVIAHSSQTLAELAAIGAAAPVSIVIPHGPIPVEAVSSRSWARRPEKRTVLLFGRIERYKGVEDLLLACDALEHPLRLVIAGRCRDRDLRHELLLTASAVDAEVDLSLAHVPDEGVAELIAAADALVFPFRRVTTSGSVMLGLAAGRPLVVPALDAFAELPDECVIRYTPGVAGLRQALEQVATMPAEMLARKGDAAAGLARTAPSWDEIADRTARALAQILAAHERGSPRDRIGSR